MQVITGFSFSNLEIEEAILKAQGYKILSGQRNAPQTLIPLVRDADPPPR